jgi:hypothetical protein
MLPTQTAGRRDNLQLQTHRGEECVLARWYLIFRGRSARRASRTGTAKAHSFLTVGAAVLCCSYPTLLRTAARPCFPRNHSVCKINDLERLAMGRSYGINVTIGPALGSDRIGPARMQENLSTTGHSSCRSHLSCHNHSMICYLRGIATYFLRKKMRRAE